MTAPQARNKATKQEFRSVAFDVPSHAASASVKIWGSDERAFRIERVWYNNPTGLAADTTNYFDVTITDGTNILASWSTKTTSQGALTADTPVNLVLAAAHDVAPNLSLVVTCTLHGTQTLPAGRIVVSGHSL